MKKWYCVRKTYPFEILVLAENENAAASESELSFSKYPADYLVHEATPKELAAKKEVT
jgi:hypothetical protein